MATLIEKNLACEVSTNNFKIIVLPCDNKLNSLTLSKLKNVN